MPILTLEDRFSGFCLGCERIVQNAFELRPEGRLCTASSCRLHREWPQVEHGKLVTVIPDWRTVDRGQLVGALPLLRDSASPDIFARWADSDSDFPTDRQSFVSHPDPRTVAAALPYSTDFLQAHCRLTCGAAVCYRSKRLQAWVRQPNVFVLDLSTYNWSRTLKDPRSWAIVNVAIERDIRNLTAWTAGNAGLGLALLARACNHYRSPMQRLRVFALYDRYDRSMDGAVRRGLKRSDCHLVPVPSIRKEILGPAQIEEKVRTIVAGLPQGWKEGEYWDVTDGWDAVGMVMYRLLMAQVIRDLAPTHVIAPLGTGNLMLGLLLAVRDCVAAGALNNKKPIVAAAMPRGENIVQQIARRKETVPRYAPPPARGKPPCMPKIACTYTPLVACIDSFLDRDDLIFYETDSNDQRSAAGQMFGQAQGRRIASEPSSIAAFAALPKLANDHLNDNQAERVLIVNSGFGITSAAEDGLLEGLGMFS